MTNASRHGERGQTIPFWVFASLMALSLVVFTFNYANTVRYQIRAQNAADSAATAALSSDAARLNSVQTLLLALNVQEFNTRNVISAVPDLLTGGDANCTGAGIVSSTCLNDLSSAVTDVSNEVGNLQSVENSLSTFSGQLTGNNLGSLGSTVSSFYANNCVNLSTDCSFKYTTQASLVDGYPVVDEYACEKVPTFEYSFLPNAPQYYDAVGHTTYTLAPLGQNLNAGNGEAGLTNSVLTGTAPLFPNISNSAIVGNYANLNIGTGYYSTIPVTSTAQPQSVKNICPQ